MTIFVVAIIIILFVLLAIYIYKESSGFHIVKYELINEKLKKDSIKFVFISDLHNKQYGELNREVIDAVDDINPDYVFLGGDMITSCMEKWKDYSDTVEFVKILAQKYKVFYGMGNHEERLRRVPEKFPDGCYERLTDLLKKANAPILDNEHIMLIEDGIDVYGLNLEHKYYRKVITRKFDVDYLSGVLGTPDESVFNILIAHNPEHFEGYAKWGADLTLSGHVHGGIVRLPILGGVVSPALKLFPKYDGGMFKYKDSTMILSRGLGSHTIPIRINNKAEVISIELKRK